MQVGDEVVCVDGSPHLGLGTTLDVGRTYKLTQCSLEEGRAVLEGVEGSWTPSRFRLATKKPPKGPNAEQVGGTHYQGTSIQPWDFIIANQLGFLEGSIIKYVARFKRKGGLEDLKKAKHFLDKLIEETE